MGEQQSQSRSGPVGEGGGEEVGEGVCEVAADPEQALRGLRAGGAGERAACVLCGAESEYPADAPGSPLCPVCTWQQAQRAACSG
ncbi:hypothetical protein AB0O31_16500 [Kitasatospora cineracea]|uniref:hypothetical protein n=1 Tax=Kitasatospora cineracea TaxID=88074 RepID=UPI003419772B